MRVTGVAYRLHPLARPLATSVQSIWGRPSATETDVRSAGYPASQPRLGRGPEGLEFRTGYPDPRGTAWAVFSRIRITGLRQDPRPAGRERGLEFGYPVPPARDSASPFPERRSRSHLPRESERDPIPHSRYPAQAEALPRSPFLRERDERFCVPESRQRYPLQREEVPRYTSG